MKDACSLAVAGLIKSEKTIALILVWQISHGAFQTQRISILF